MSTGAFSTAYDPRRELPAVMASGCVNQTVSVGLSPTLSSAFHTPCTLIRVFPTVDTFIDIGASPVAGPTKVFCAGGIYQFFGVKADERLSCVSADGETGTLYVMEGGT